MRGLVASSCLSIAVLGAACAGVVGDPGSSGEGSGAGGSGASGGGSGGATAQRDPNRVTLHRLNSAEYNNTVRDLLGTGQRPAADFPADDHGFGFDNIADVLSVSPSLVELYERAAEALVAEALALPTADPVLLQVEGENLSSSVGAATADAWNLWSSGDLTNVFVLPADGRYRVSARVWGDQAGPEPARAQLVAGNTDLGTFDVASTRSSPQVISGEAQLNGGSRPVTVSFVNDYYDQAAGLDRNLYVDWISVEGPLDATMPNNALRDRIVVCDPVAGGDACVRDILRQFTRRAWRRPVTDAEVDRLKQLVDVAAQHGEDVNAGLNVALRGVLVSPHFLFRVELDADPASPASHPLSDHELASRLSYFLWSSMPDEALFAAADAGILTDPDEIERQVRRMLADPKAAALVDNFAGQWLLTRALDSHEPDYAYFPEYDHALRDALKGEARSFFQEMLDARHPIETMLLADFTYVNDRLAQHYGISGTFGASHERVPLTFDQRGGVLRQGGILTVTSYPTRTSPVKRGKWVLGSLLCSEPKPPPPGVEADLPKEELAGKTLREVLELHREKEICAQCHDLMDPIGLALQNFDAIGRWRATEESGDVVDPTGVLPDGTPVDGPASLAAAVAADARFPECVTEKTFVYALGRGMLPSDAPYLRSMLTNLGGAGFALDDLVVQITRSEPFRLRRGEPPEEAP